MRMVVLLRSHPVVPVAGALTHYPGHRRASAFVRRGHHNV